MGRIARMTSLVLLLWLECAYAAVGILDTEYLKKGVVRITATSPGENPKVGTGFIVQLEQDIVYIVTAAHVVSGDAHPKVQFFIQQDIQVQATVKHSESTEDANGLALLIIRGKEVIPSGLTVLNLTKVSHLSGADPILVVGHPRSAGDWAILSGSVVARQGRYVTIDANIDEGTSGAPILHLADVVGLVGEVRRYGRGVTSGSIREYLEGHGILKNEALSSNPPAVVMPNKRSQENKSEIAREITGKDGAPMVLIPAGEFMMGSQENDLSAQDDERPAHLVYLDAFYLDRYEVTTSRYARFLKETGRTVPRGWSDQVPEQNGNKPVVGMNWYDSVAYCTWAGKRLPTEAEWEKAARGTDQRRYPWGNDAPNERRANFVHGPFNSKAYEMLTDVGSYEEGKSSYGVYDMAGNAWEWVADWYEGGQYSRSLQRNPRGPDSGGSHVFRGGAWNSALGIVPSATRKHADTTAGYDVLGFRCALHAR